LPADVGIAIAGSSRTVSSEAADAVITADLNALRALQARSMKSRALCGIVHLVVNDPFRALSHPIRRGIVERLAAGPATVGDATAGFGVSKPAITKHLKVLEETGVVTRVVEGRTHRLSLEPDVMSEAADWMDRQRTRWERLFDVVDEYLKENP
jgi:DNA-binding transcriptional ArsR family regulator